MILETSIALGAGFISVCAFFLTWWQGYETRRHNKLSVKPHIDLRTDSDRNEGDYRGSLKNNGVGPAIIKTFEVYIKENNQQIKADSINAAFITLLPEHQADKSKFMTFNKTISVFTGDTIPLFKLYLADKTEDGQRRVSDALSKITFIIIYESFYGEKFYYPSKDEVQEITGNKLQ